MIQSFTIPGKLPSLNEVTAWNRGNRYAAARKKRELEAMIGWCIRHARLVPMTERVTMTITWIEPDWRRDYDNIESAVKFVQDALVKCGIIPGDSQKHLAPPVHVHDVDRLHPRVVVTLEDAS
jgi:Holliday junction resolvase RusA-like endonuclease